MHERNKRKEIDKRVDREADRVIDRGRGVAEKEDEMGRWGTVQHIKFDHHLDHY